MRKDADEFVKLYEQGYSCSQIGKMFGITRQAAWEVLWRRKVVFRVKQLLPFVMYDGLKFTISKTTGYYRQTDQRKKHVSLQRYVWQKEKGEIPEGWDIHHIDGNKTNNNISNLECLPKADHTRLHQKLKKETNGSN